jgi:hypothetical protein
MFFETQQPRVIIAVVQMSHKKVKILNLNFDFFFFLQT